MFVVKPDISAPSSSGAKDSPLQYICTGEGNILLSSPSLLWGDTRLFRRVEFGVSEQSEEPMTQQHIVRRPGNKLASKTCFITVSLGGMELLSVPNSTCFSWKQSQEMSWITDCLHLYLAQGTDFA